jgi:hypothetical protein
LPKIKPYDDAVNNRVRVGNFEKTFVAGEPQNSYELKQDLNLETEMATVSFQQAFVNLLVKTYTDFIKAGGDEKVPVEVLNAKKLWIGENDEYDVISKLLIDYEITNYKEDYVTSENIAYWLKDTESNISSKKFGVELKRYCDINNFNNVRSDIKKISGKSVRVWFGIKYIPEVFVTEEKK